MSISRPWKEGKSGLLEFGLGIHSPVFFRRMTFQSYDERKTASEQLKRESEQFRRLFERLIRNSSLDETSVSEPVFLYGSLRSRLLFQFELVTDVLPAAGEMLALSDKSLLPLEVSSFVRKYPDVGAEQLAGLLQMREDMGRTEARQLAQEILEQNRFRPKSQALITRVFSGLLQ